MAAPIKGQQFNAIDAEALAKKPSIKELQMKLAIPFPLNPNAQNPAPMPGRGRVLPMAPAALETFVPECPTDLPPELPVALETFVPECPTDLPPELPALTTATLLSPQGIVQPPALPPRKVSPQKVVQTSEKVKETAPSVMLISNDPQLLNCRALLHMRAEFGTTEHRELVRYASDAGYLFNEEIGVFTSADWDVKTKDEMKAFLDGKSVSSAPMEQEIMVDPRVQAIASNQGYTFNKEMGCYLNASGDPKFTEDFLKEIAENDDLLALAKQFDHEERNIKLAADAHNGQLMVEAIRAGIDVSLEVLIKADFAGFKPHESGVFISKVNANDVRFASDFE